MNFNNVTYTGQSIDDLDIFNQLPSDLQALLRQINGFVQFDGGLHVRGACIEPDWHGIRTVWGVGELALHRLYASVRVADVPFAEDALGDQFLLRGGKVYRLSIETGELADLGCGLTAFFEYAQRDPMGYLGLQPLARFLSEGQRLQVGQLLHVWPPFFAQESAHGQVKLKGVSFRERIEFAAYLAKQVADLEEGDTLELDFSETSDQ